MQRKSKARGRKKDLVSKINIIEDEDDDTWVQRVSTPNDTSTSQEEVEDNGQSLKFPNTYTLWTHDINNKNWEIKSYNKLVTIDNASDFWKVVNQTNFKKLGIKFNHFFFMKNDVHPTWEHPENRNGGVCSFKVELNKSPQVFEDLTARMVCGLLTPNYEDINGISVSPKNNWAIIKIWNKSSDNDLSKTLSQEVVDKYSELGIRYKPNIPEY